MPELPKPLEEVERVLEGRYENLRTVGRGMGFHGRALKVLAFLLGGGCIIGSFSAGFMAAAMVLAGVVVFVMTFGLGIIVSAAGEACGAIADTAKGTMLSAYASTGLVPSGPAESPVETRSGAPLDLPTSGGKSPLQQMADLDRSRRG